MDCIFPAGTVQRACWLSSCGIKPSSWSFLSFHTGEPKRAAISCFWLLTKFWLHLLITQLLAESYDFLLFCLVRLMCFSFHSLTDRKVKKKSLCYFLGTTCIVASAGEAGLGRWYLVYSHWCLSGCSDYCRSSTLDYNTKKNSGNWKLMPKSPEEQEKNIKWDWPVLSFQFSNLILHKGIEKSRKDTQHFGDSKKQWRKLKMSQWG